MSDIKILHAFGDSPTVEFTPDIHIERGRIYLVNASEKYTVTKTDEQKEAYINMLEERLSKAELQLAEIRNILYPEGVK